MEWSTDYEAHKQPRIVDGAANHLTKNHYTGDTPCFATMESLKNQTRGLEDATPPARAFPPQVNSALTATVLFSTNAASLVMAIRPKYSLDDS